MGNPARQHFRSDAATRRAPMQRGHAVSGSAPHRFLAASSRDLYPSGSGPPASILVRPADTSTSLLLCAARGCGPHRCRGRQGEGAGAQRAVVGADPHVRRGGVGCAGIRGGGARGAAAAAVAGWRAVAGAGARRRGGGTGEPEQGPGPASAGAANPLSSILGACRCAQAVS